MEYVTCDVILIFLVIIFIGVIDFIHRLMEDLMED